MTAETTLTMRPIAPTFGAEVADMPVSLFLDPKLLQDRNADDVSVVTLSYTFFKASAQPTTQVSEAK